MSTFNLVSKIPKQYKVNAIFHSFKISGNVACNQIKAGYPAKATSHNKRYTQSSTLFSHSQMTLATWSRQDCQKAQNSLNSKNQSKLPVKYLMSTINLVWKIPTQCKVHWIFHFFRIFRSKACNLIKTGLRAKAKIVPQLVVNGNTSTASYINVRNYTTRV